MNYYNEIDPYAAQWLRNLIEAGHIAPGVVDERSIEDVLPSELANYTQCHFFAGIGIWSHALRQAGFPDDRPVWTGSCPCQPFSAAGKGGGFVDERHLWPAFHHLISQCRPPIVLGEQVASKDANLWTDLVQADLGGVGYAFAAVPFPAASVEGFHIRDRLYWAAYAGEYRGGSQAPPTYHPQQEAERPSNRAGRCGSVVDMACPEVEWVLCSDGKRRPIEPGLCAVVDAYPERVGRLRAYGNAIDAKAAQTFIEAVMEYQP